MAACHSCGATKAAHVCGQCHLALYCRASCQRAHWLTTHGRTCAALAALGPAPPLAFPWPAGTRGGLDDTNVQLFAAFARAVLDPAQLEKLLVSPASPTAATDEELANIMWTLLADVVDVETVMDGNDFLSEAPTMRLRPPAAGGQSGFCQRVLAHWARLRAADSSDASATQENDDADVYKRMWVAYSEAERQRLTRAATWPTLPPLPRGDDTTTTITPYSLFVQPNKTTAAQWRASIEQAIIAPLKDTQSEYERFLDYAQDQTAAAATNDGQRRMYIIWLLRLTNDLVQVRSALEYVQLAAADGTGTPQRVLWDYCRRVTDAILRQLHVAVLANADFGRLGGPTVTVTHQGALKLGTFMRRTDSGQRQWEWQTAVARKDQQKRQRTDDAPVPPYLVTLANAMNDQLRHLVGNPLRTMEAMARFFMCLLLRYPDATVNVQAGGATELPLVMGLAYGFQAHVAPDYYDTQILGGADDDDE